MAGRLAITISRQLGSGGAEIGQRIAGALGLKYLDREILRAAAAELGLKETDIAGREERIAPFWEKVILMFSACTPDSPYVPPPVPLQAPGQQVFEVESQIIQAVADREDCVIVGRAGSYVLRRHPGLVSILLHAPMEFRVQRAMRVYSIATASDAHAMVKASDQTRRTFISRVAGREWMDARAHHLTLDTSALPIDTTVDLIVDFISKIQAARSG
jgi:cytidylate kinase